jgi:tRNA(Ile)-lysidine synthase
MALLRLLHDLSTQQHWPLQLVVAHCNHRVRPDADAAAAHVAAFAAAHQLPFHESVAQRSSTGHWPEVGWARMRLCAQPLLGGMPQCVLPKLTLGMPRCLPARAHRNGLQEAARVWRHEQLQVMARQADCSFIALGHTATERAETVLLNLIRWERQLRLAGWLAGWNALCVHRHH